MKYLVMCEGTNEKKLIELLLENKRLKITFDDLLGRQVYHARQIKTSPVVKTNLAIYGKEVEVWRIGDKQTDKLIIPSDYKNQIKSVKKYCTLPELEILLIISEKKCKEYEKMLAEAGGVDLQVLGIGQNGHIGFNEPDEKLESYTHVTGLTESTINANARFFDSVNDVPTKAITMGMASIMSAKKIVILASGESKKDAVKALLDDKITTSVPATLLKTHPDVILICDKEAYAL